jgi:hypothetical protein
VINSSSFAGTTGRQRTAIRRRNARRLPTNGNVASSVRFQPSRVSVSRMFMLRHGSLIPGALNIDPALTPHLTRPLRPQGRRGAWRRRYESLLRPWGQRGTLRRRHKSPLRPRGRRGRVRWGHGRVRLSNRWYNLGYGHPGIGLCVIIKFRGSAPGVRGTTVTAAPQNRKRFQAVS